MDYSLDLYTYRVSCMVSGADDMYVSAFVLIDGHRGVYYSESWKPNGSTLYLPVSGTVLANVDKYDQISFEQGCFCIGDEAGRFQQKAQGQTINCWRYSQTDRKLFIALSYFFTNGQVSVALKVQVCPNTAPRLHQRRVSH
ncbi:hypothetical protein NFI96_017286 [Prochilodus magdalenae]|nr:hypothetical protein NFI96_017286 [Prochilodus magdalenae]